MSVEGYYLPTSADEAVGYLAEHGSSLVLMAGGTIAMQPINEGEVIPQHVMGLRHAGLNYVRRSNGHLTIGATTTLNQIIAQDDIPLLQTAAHRTGAWAIRNMGTVGGNLFAPPPAGDFAVALLALDAEVTAVNTRGDRVIPLAEFYTGWMENVLEPDELVTEIRVPASGGETAYTKFGRRQMNTPAVVTVAVRIVRDGDRVTDARIALNAVGPHPLRATDAEAVLAGSTLDEAAINEAAAAAAEQSEPFTDAIASDWYRRKMVDVYVRRTLAQIAA